MRLGLVEGQTLTPEEVAARIPASELAKARAAGLLNVRTVEELDALLAAQRAKPQLPSWALPVGIAVGVVGLLMVVGAFKPAPRVAMAGYRRRK